VIFCRFSLATILLALSLVPATAQFSIAPGSKTPLVGKDTLCFAYEFAAGDTCVFLTEAVDSVIFPGSPTVLKERQEETIVVCDSVVSDTVFFLTMWLSAAHEAQRTTGSTDTTMRTSFPWVNRRTHLVITRSGKRLRVYTEQPTRAATTPGGIFRPLLLPPLGGDCARQYQSWQHIDTVMFAENAVPEPIAFTNALYRVLDFVDSALIRYRQIQYTQTSIGSYDLQQGGVDVNLHAVINSYGKMTFDPVRLLPVHHAATSEQKITIKRIGQQDTGGRHLLLMHTRLVELRSLLSRRTLKRLPNTTVRGPR